jgi:DNA-binding transcriptional LysR family regulator
MVATPALDLDLLRTLIAIAEEGGFTRAGERVGRTQSAVSLQVQRLEAVVGRTLVARGKGGVVELTAHGTALVERGRALLALNDDILKAVQAQPAHAAVRLGVDCGYSRRLPDILARMAATHPHVTVEVASAASCELGPMLKANTLDLMLCQGGLEPRQWPAVEVWRGPLAWIVSDAHPRQFDDPLPLALSPAECPFRPPWMTQCLWRSAALAALERAGRRYKIVSTSSGGSAWHAAALAGLAIFVWLPDEVPEGLRPARPDDRLPELPEANLLLLKAREPRQPVTDALYAHILDSFEVRSNSSEA